MPDFPKSVRILRPQEFRQAYDQGQKHGCPLFVVFYRQRGDLEGPRFGFTTPRAIGKSVVRNRIKRRLRECVRLRRERFPFGLDLVFNPRKSLLDAPWEEIERHVDKLLERLIAKRETAPCEASSSPS